MKSISLKVVRVAEYNSNGELQPQYTAESEAGGWMSIADCIEQLRHEGYEVEKAPDDYIVNGERVIFIEDELDLSNEYDLKILDSRIAAVRKDSTAFLAEREL